MERISINELTPEHLFRSHISKRKPLVISGVPTDASFQAFKKWTDINYLRTQAGAAKIKVEPMHTSKKQYGTDTPRVDTTFASFLSSLQSASPTYNYLTTQYSDDATPSEEAFPEPVRSLLKDVPLSPAIMGNLVLQQMNLWLGRSGAGTSSGLHHDFHDNLYVLLKGRKRFVLFPPEGVRHFNPYGKLDKVHENGLIVYKAPGEEEDGEQNDAVRADGLTERDAAGLRVKALEKKMEALQGVEGKEDELEGLEEIYDEAVENMMDFMIDEAQGEDGDEDDFDDDEEGLEGDEELGALMEKIKAHVAADSVTDGKGKGKKRKAEDDLDQHESKVAKGNKALKNNGSDDDEDDEEGFDGFGSHDEEDDEEDNFAGFGADNDNDNDDDDASDSDDEQLKAVLAKATAKSPTSKEQQQQPSEPLSFSQIPTQELHQHLALKKPQKTSAALAKAPKPLIVELKAGDMLYLPTSWWHEVTSFSEEGEDEKAGSKKEGKKEKAKVNGKEDSDNIHMALNYWFHPPDQLHDFDQPYRDELVWEFMASQVKEAYEELVGEV